MQESWRFRDMSLETDEALDSAHWIEQVFVERKTELGIFLSYYFRSEGAVVENVSLQSRQSETATNGTLAVRFDLVHFNACLNIHEQGKESMELRYEALPSQRELVLTGPFWPEREPDGF
ncbi:MAG: hypothetical protein JJU34_19450 [Lunatimonas sp.]|uniref:hypothetical protein n=1 Tax=Lunatimonas sp. TaxID=2060141 RepID=UPI00263A46AD|nr:hypothetical protein [Lunatimonas sp.]MCC5939463.1 hypothetical protein [Lunatimonas sp.]